jgi:hypothetical protein
MRMGMEELLMPSMKAFSNLWQGIAVVELSVSGVAVTLVLAILATHSEDCYFVPLFPCSL